MRTAVEIANFFIQRAKEQGDRLTPMKLQKLLYYSYGWYLTTKEDGDTLFDEPIQAWKFGPVVNSVYHETKNWGTGVIDEQIKMNGHAPIVDEKEIKDFLEKIWRVYSKYDGIELSKATHNVDSPWTKTFQKYNGNLPYHTVIEDNEMKMYFNSLLEN